MRRVNIVIKREWYIIFIIDDVILDLNGLCVFLKLDLNFGYY